MLAWRREKRLSGRSGAGTSRADNHNDYDGYGESLRQRVFRELDRNPLLTPSALRRILMLGREVSLQVLANYKTQWRHNRRNERGSKCSLHGWRGWCFVPVGLDRVRALEVGWGHVAAWRQVL